ncbi:hypothetical protein [Sphingomonas sp. R86521]|uniref:hypothetical protein n=1 Tax=Sphingomonas sp. R86521 TaxID=3093860 RepID=UPI0036D22F7A
MNDRNPSDPRAARAPSQRAKTLVVRCWREGSVADAAVLRGTVRDLSRGRAVGFEGFDRLVDLLDGAFAADDMLLVPTGGHDEVGSSNGSTDRDDVFR